jgi:hypothetical protein
MKAVLISIQPKWCELIASGKKTVEVRKTRPKLETPFKCYIYCTEAKGSAFFTEQVFEGEKGNYAIPHLGNRKVIGEFVCDRIVDIPHSQYFVDYYHAMPQVDLKATCLDMGHIDEYLLSKDGFGWHISNLVIYDVPRSLSGFKRFCDGTGGNIGCKGCEYYYSESNESIGFYEECICDNLRPLTRPPQSWCYVERLGEV